MFKETNESLIMNQTNSAGKKFFVLWKTFHG